jgi:hypothetical protein
VIKDYVKIKRNVVTSRLDEDTCDPLPDTGGAYFRERAIVATGRYLIQHMGTTRQERLLKTQFITQYEERFQFSCSPPASIIDRDVETDRKRAPKRTVGGTGMWNSPCGRKNKSQFITKE